MYDKQPNRDNEIHLDSTTRKQVYETYVNDLPGEKILSISAFCKIWHRIFPHVKIPARKAVHGEVYFFFYFSFFCTTHVALPRVPPLGKCTVCAQLTELMRSHCTQREKSYYRGLFTFHASTFMSERKQYYARRLQGKMEPESYLSMIMDGMAQVIPNYLFIVYIFM